MLWLDAGDEYQGTIESNPNRGQAMVRFLNAAGLSAAAIGNHEFDFGADPASPNQSGDLLGSLKARMREAQYPYLSANIVDTATGQLDPFPNTEPSHLFTVGELKVGVIGLSTIDTPKTTLPMNVKTLTFAPLHDAALKQAAALRAQGAQIVVIDAHAGAFCDLTHGNQGHLLRKPTDAQGVCRPEDEMTKLIKSLPAGTVDAVVSGHTHSIIHHWMREGADGADAVPSNVPVIQGGANGRYFNIIYLTYDLKNQKILNDRTRIEGPIPVCPAVFGNQGDCNGDRPAPKNGRGELITPQFHRVAIHADSDVSSVLRPYFEQADRTKNEVVGQAATHLSANRGGEGALGNLFADAIRESARADFALMNAGGIRADLEQGPITFGEVFRSSPFDNSIVTIRLSGKQLKNILRVAESGARGFPPVSGLVLKLIHPETDAPSNDLNGDGRIDPWEINRLLEAKLPDGRPVDDRKEYTLAMIDFLVLGGDDFAWPMSQIDPKQIQYTGILTRDALSNHIRELTARDGAVNSPSHPLVSATEARLVFIKTTKKAKTRKRRRKHKSV
jgi:5'-nucleotidase